MTSSRDLPLVLLCCFAISLLLSLSQILSDPVINKDAIIYIQSAHFIQIGDWQTAGKLYNWLFYPILIAAASSMTNLGLENAAHLLGALFNATTCSLFVLLVHALGGTHRRVLWLAALVVLCFPQFNEYRNMIIRDHGYWACYLAMGLSFVHLYRKFSIPWFGLFFFSALTATFFRIEGMVFLLVLSFFLIWQHRSLYTLKCVANSSLRSQKCILTIVIIILCCFVFGYFYLWNGAGKLHQFSFLLGKIANSGQHQTSIDIARDYLNTLTSPKTHSENYAGLILAATVASILVGEILHTTGWFYVGILVLGVFSKKPLLQHDDRKAWTILIGLNLLILATFVLAKFFLTGRYPIALSLTLLLLLPFILEKHLHAFLSHEMAPKYKKVSYVLFGLFCLVSLDSLISMGASKLYLKEAGSWLGNHIGDEQKLFSNHPHITYYAHQSLNRHPRAISQKQFMTMAQNGKLKKYDFVAIELGRREKEIESQVTKYLNKPPEKEFSNKRGDRVLIYRP